MSKPDYVIVDKTGVYTWPGLLPFRHRYSRTGYATIEDAEARARVVAFHYAAHYGKSTPDLRVVYRPNGGPR